MSTSRPPNQIHRDSTDTRPLRCAVYTRKSSEEGLEQAFNSLDAQREAGQDYIKSQRHQGWIAIKAVYDDGGYSGGSTNRPGLQRLLADIHAGRVDVVVVYKVDRLSRSLADFARLMQVFDEKNVSFVSVTQQFNTTTSMGRLTLNMLLSFAQFEREVTGERIRDKIAATKRKGVWVGGRPPLGYRIPSRKDADYIEGDRVLKIVETEAVLVRAVFDGYLKHGSLLTLASELNAQGFRTRAWTGRDGRKHGSKSIERNHLYKVLTNPVYIGKITHCRRTQRTAATGNNGHDQVGRRSHHTRPGDIYDGLHKPIVDRKTWDRVQQAMALIPRSSMTRDEWNGRHLLKGLMRTSEGWVMSPTWAQKRPTKKAKLELATGKQITLYYVSQKAIRKGYATCPIRCINAAHIDDLVRALVLNHCKTVHKTNLAPLAPLARDIAIREVIRSVTVSPDTLAVELDTSRIGAAEAAAKSSTPLSEHSRRRGADASSIPFQVVAPSVSTDGTLTQLTLKINIRRFDSRRLLVSPDGRELYSRTLPANGPQLQDHIRLAIGLAYAWHSELLRTGESISSLAHRYSISEARIYCLLSLTHLSPTILGKALRGLLGPNAALTALLETAERINWSRQHELRDH